MRSINVNGKDIKTNFGEESMYHMHSGNPGKTQRMESPRKAETDKEFLERLVNSGYKQIRFARCSTRVTGWHETIALCRR